MRFLGFGKERQSSPEENFDIERKIVGFVIADTVYFRCNLLYPDVPEEEILSDFLNKEASETAAMGFRAQYLGDKNMAKNLKIKPTSDPRVTEVLKNSVKINTDIVQLGKLIREEITHYLLLDEEARWDYVKPKAPNIFNTK